MSTHEAPSHTKRTHPWGFCSSTRSSNYFILVFHLPSACGLATSSPTQPLCTDCVTRLSPSTSLSTGAPQDCVPSTLHQWLYYSPSDKHHHWVCPWRSCDWANENGRWGSEWIQSHCGLMELVRNDLWLFRAQPLKVSTNKITVW